MKIRARPQRRKPGHIYVGATELRRRRGRKLVALLVALLVIAAVIWLALGWELAASRDVGRTDPSMQMPSRLL